MAEAKNTVVYKTAAGVGWLAGFQVVRQLLQVVSVSILARRVPPAAYGLVAMATLVTTFLETVRDGGIGYALGREREVSDELGSTAFWLSCTLSVASTLTVIAASFPAARFFHEPRVATVLQFLSISFFFGAINVVPAALLNREMAFRKLALAQTAGAICGTSVAIAVALSGGKIWSLVSGSIAMNATTTTAIWLASPLRVRAGFHPSRARHMFSFGLNLSGFHVVNYFSRNTDNLLVGRFLGSVSLAYYQMGYMLMLYPLLYITETVTQVIYPGMSKFHEDLERFRAAYLRVSGLVAFFTIPLMLGLAVTASPFVRVFLSPRWMPVAGLLAVFAPLGALQSIYNTVSVIYIAYARTDLQFRWAVFASAMYVLSFAVGLRWGILGVASSYALVWTLLMVPAFAIPFRIINLPGSLFIRTLWPTANLGVVMAAVAWSWRYGLNRVGVKNSVVELTSTVAIGIATYVGLVWWRKPPALSDLALILEGSSNPMLRGIAAYLHGPVHPT
jgi:O-antigen/teichoic acid export membrane protein